MSRTKEIMGVDHGRQDLDFLIELDELDSNEKFQCERCGSECQRPIVGLCETCFREEQDWRDDLWER